MFDLSSDLGFTALFLSAFVSATILPGNSEIVLVAFLAKFPAHLWSAVAVATLGNTAGGLTSYAIGRLAPSPPPASTDAAAREGATTRAMTLLHRYGVWVLLFSWVPIIGDAFCVAAGWLRFGVWRCALLLALGKAARYVVIALGGAWVASL